MKILAVLVFLAATALAPGEETVKALRYRQLIVDDAMDYAHGGGRWHDVLFLPDRKLVAQVVWEWDAELKEFPRMHAFDGTLEEQLAARPKDGSEGKKEPEEIRISAALAKEIAELAELAKRQKEMSLRLGKAAVEGKAVGGRDSVKPRSE